MSDDERSLAAVITEELPYQWRDLGVVQHTPRCAVRRNARLVEGIMKRWVYAQAVVTNSMVGSPRAIRFRGVEVEADTEVEAYQEGQRWAARFKYHPEIETVNDWVTAILKYEAVAERRATKIRDAHGKCSTKASSESAS